MKYLKDTTTRNIVGETVKTILFVELDIESIINNLQGRVSSLIHRTIQAICRIAEFQALEMKRVKNSNNNMSFFEVGCGTENYRESQWLEQIVNKSKKVYLQKES